MKKFLLFSFSVLLIGALVAGYFLFLDSGRARNRSLMVVQFLKNPEKHSDWKIDEKAKCGEAPFLFPTNGFIGYLWDDTFKPGHRHQGIDAFAGTEPGVTAVYAVYDGYLTRQADWKSSVIIRIPSDPLNQGRQIWTYYTHMADVNGNSYISSQFPAGTREEFVKAGTFLGYVGNYSGTAGTPTGVHLHFSVVKDDGQGSYKNELEISNTYDPSPYFGLTLKADDNPEMPILCSE